MKVLKKNTQVQYATGNHLYASSDHLVFESGDNGITWKEVCRLRHPSGLFGLCKDLVLRSPLVRTSRGNIGISNVVVLPSGTVIALYDRIYRYTGQGRYALPVFDMVGQHIHAPLKNGLCYDSHTNALYFGEYICERPNSIRILKGTNDGNTWELCYTFPEGRIRHVHSIITDPYRKRIWICTGDSDKESGLFYTDDGFNSVHLFGGGDQSWRMVSLISTKDALYWGSDAGGDAPAGTSNYIYRYNWNRNKREVVAETANPVYFSMRTPEGFFMSTTYEPHKPPPTKEVSELWFSPDGIDWKVVCEFPYKYIKSGGGTKYGMIVLPTGNSNKILFSPINTSKNHFSILSLQEVH